MENCGDFYRALIKAVLRGAWMFLVIFSLLSCFTGRPDYPSNWASRLQSPSTADYSGEYNESLLHLLKVSPINLLGTGECTYDYIIDVTGIKYRPACPSDCDSKSFEYQAITSPDYHLVYRQKKQGLQIIYKPRFKADNPVAGYQREYLILSNAADGSLIVEKVGKVYGLAFMIFPVAASEHLWYRFYDGKIEFLN